MASEEKEILAKAEAILVQAKAIVGSQAQVIATLNKVLDSSVNEEVQGAVKKAIALLEECYEETVRLSGEIDVKNDDIQVLRKKDPNDEFKKLNDEINVLYAGIQKGDNDFTKTFSASAEKIKAETQKVKGSFWRNLLKEVILLRI